MGAESQEWQEFGRAIRSRREQRQMTQRQLGELISWAYSMVSRWEAGGHRPPVEAIEAMDAALGAEGRLISLGFRAAMADSNRLRKGTVEAKASTWDEDDEMERRRLLQFAAGVGAMGALGADDAVRKVLDLTMEPRPLDDWHLACADHLHAVRTRPPMQAHRDLLVDLAALQRQLSLGEPDTAELYRVVAVLASYEGSVMTRLADPGAAIRWYRTAKSAANASGDLDLRVRVRAHEAGHSLYGLRDPGTVLALCEEAERLAGSSPSVGLVMTLRIKAHALAQLGRHQEAFAELRRFLELAHRDIPTVTGWWNGNGSINLTESQVHAAAGRTEDTVKAVESVVANSAITDYHVPVNARLHLAQCAVVNGDIDGGADMAAAALDSIAPPYRNSMTTETAQRVLSVVPMDQRQHPAVAQLRHLAITA